MKHVKRYNVSKCIATIKANLPGRVTMKDEVETSINNALIDPPLDLPKESKVICAFINTTIHDDRSSSLMKIHSHKNRKGE